MISWAKKIWLIGFLEMLTGTNLVENKAENKKQSTESSYFQLKITTDFF